MRAPGPAAAEMLRIRARMKQYDAMPEWARKLVADHGFAKTVKAAEYAGWNADKTAMVLGASRLPRLPDHRVGEIMRRLGSGVDGET